MWPFLTADDLIVDVPTPRFIDHSFEADLFLYLAKAAKWLLGQSGLSLENGRLRERYHNLLLQRGYAYYNGSVKNEKLFAAFTNHFEANILEKLGCVISSAQRGWLRQFTGDKTHIKLNHPLRHLLVLFFLDVNVADFFTSFTEYRPFGLGPYPCLNVACGRYHALTIPECKVFDARTAGRRGNPAALFICDCGFKYQRSGPDTSEADRYRYSSVTDYGKVWEAKLRELWTNTNLPMSALAARLNVAAATVTGHAIRLKLPMNETGARPVAGYNRFRNPRQSFAEKLHNHRRIWLNNREKNPDCTRAELTDFAPNTYHWLRRNDTSWLKKQPPMAQLRIGRRSDTRNWNPIDERLAAKVKAVSGEIIESEDWPVRVSKLEIVRRVGHRSWLTKKHAKLPKAVAALEDCCETLEDYMLRKVIVAERLFITERVMPSLSVFQSRARVQYGTDKVAIAVQEAMERIKANLMAGMG
jgi:hypothetical protein